MAASPNSIVGTSLRKVTLFIVALLMVLQFNQCKKVDRTILPPGTPNRTLDTLTPTEKKFFNLPEGTNPLVASIANKILRQEQHKPFVQKFVTYAGYPVWDKSVISSIKSTQTTTLTRGGGEGGEKVVFIPLALRNDSSVNSILKVKVSRQDTVFKMLYRWQYKQHGYMKNDTTNNADQTALFFMGLESHTFGHKTFKIRDTMLFQHDNMAFNYLSITAFNQVPVEARKQLVQVEVCREYYEDDHHGQLGDGVAPGETIGYELVRECDYYSFWVDSGGGGNGGTTGDSPPVPPGTSGGAPDDGAGWTDNPCDPLGGGSGEPTTRLKDPCDDPPAWEPLPELPELPEFEEPEPININLSEILELTTEESQWLSQNPDLLQVISSGLLGSLNDTNPETGLPYTDFSDDAITASRLCIIASMNGIIEGPYNQTNLDLLLPYAPSEWSNIQNPILIQRFSIECAIIKAEHPEYSMIRVYWEAMKEMVHISLDVAGLVPGVGEIADLANGAIYSLEGDGVNAALSFAAAIPVAGWFSAGLKFAKRTVKVANNSKTTLKWLVKTDGIIHFGTRGQLRTVLRLPKGDHRIAHHIIPWKKGSHPAIQKAAQGNDAFHLNELLNGIPLNAGVHSGNHAAYLSKVQAALDAIPTNLNSQKTRIEVEKIINRIRFAIESSPNTHIDNLIF